MAAVSSFARLGAVSLSAVLRVALYRVFGPLLYPSQAHALASFQDWSCKLWKRFRLEVTGEGAPPLFPCVYVANHRSYLDIPVLAGLVPTAFLSRADVASWPVVGTAARAIGVVFVERENSGGRIRAARALARSARRTSIVVFPEGTTAGERLPAPFPLGPFRILHRLQSSVVPVTIRYSDRRVYWTEDLPLGRHLLERVLRGRPIAVHVHFGAPIAAGTLAHAEDLRRVVYQAVCQPIETHGELCEAGL